MVVETRKSVQPQQGHAELSSHFFQFLSADVKTLKRAGTRSLNTLRAEKNEALPESNMHINTTESWEMNIDGKKKQKNTSGSGRPNKVVFVLCCVCFQQKIKKNFIFVRMSKRESSPLEKTRG